MFLLQTSACHRFTGWRADETKLLQLCVPYIIQSLGFYFHIMCSLNKWLWNKKLYEQLLDFWFCKQQLNDSRNKAVSVKAETLHPGAEALRKLPPTGPPVELQGRALARQKWDWGLIPALPRKRDKKLLSLIAANHRKQKCSFLFSGNIKDNF